MEHKKFLEVWIAVGVLIFTVGLLIAVITPPGWVFCMVLGGGMLCWTPTDEGKVSENRRFSDEKLRS